MSFGRSTKTALLVLALFTLFLFFLFWPIFRGKVNLNGNLLVSFYPPYGENLPFKNTGWDQLRIYFPFYRVTLEAFKNLDVPLWNPYAFSGHPHMADFQSAVFYPLNIFGLILPQIEFWHLLRIAPTILASFFTFLYLRNLKLSTLASFFGAMTFGFSPFILTWGEEVIMSPHSIIWLPLLLWAIERFWASQNDRNGSDGKYLAIISLATASSFFGGYMQTSIYMFIFVFGYLIFRIWQRTAGVNVNHPWGELALHLRILASFGLGAGLAAIQLLPSAELYFNSARSTIALRETLLEFLLPIESLLTYLAPDFFGHPATGNFFRMGNAQYYEGIMFVGAAALIFAMYAIFHLPSRLRGDRRVIIFLFLMAIVLLSTTLDLPTSRLLLSLPIPFLSTSIANRVLFIPTFCLSVLAAMGFHDWLNSRGKGIFKVIGAVGAIYGLIILSLLIIWLFELNYFEHAKFFSAQNVIVSLRNLALPILVFGGSSFLIMVATLRFSVKRLVALLVIVLAFLQIFYFSQKYFSFSDRKYIFPNKPILDFIDKNQGYWRTWGVGKAFLENNFASQYGIFVAGGYDSLNNRTYAEFTYAMQGNRLADFVFRADAGIGRGDARGLLVNDSRRKLIDMVGIKYLVAHEDDFGALERENFKKVFENGKYGVFENLEVLPRAFLASNYEGPPQVKDEGLSDKDIEKVRRKLIFNKLLDPDFDFRNVLILEKPSPVSPQFGEGRAQIESYKGEEVVIRTKSDQPKLLFLSDNYYSGWEATVDGDKTEILRANYTFRAVPLVPGEHEVRFYYDPMSFKLGLVISVASLGGIGFFLFGSKFKVQSAK